MMDLYKVSAEVLPLLDQLEELRDRLTLARQNKGGDPDVITCEIVALEDTIEGFDLELEKIVEDLSADIQNHKIYAKACKAEASEWSDKAKRAEERAEREKALLKYIMEQNGTRKMQAGLFSVSIITNGGKRPIVYNPQYDPEELPEQFRIEEVTYKPDIDAIRGFLEAGGESDYFELGERGEHLRIK